MDNRAWILCTKWSGDKSYRLAEQAISILTDFGFDIEFDKVEHTGTGTTELNFDGSLHYEVGVKEITQNPRKLFPIQEALAPVVSCFHEVCGHGGQWRHETLKNQPLSKALLLNDMACQTSPEFYGIDPLYREPTPRYFRQSHEIAAQYMGLKMTQKFLTAVYDNHTAERLLCEYTNLRLASGNEFISFPNNYKMEESKDGRKPYQKPTEPFTSMKQIYVQFQKDFIKQVFAPADYKTTKASNDLVSEYIHTRKWPWERAWAGKQINRTGDRLTQAYLLAGVWLKEYGDVFAMRELPVFRDMNFPRNLPEHPKERELDLTLLTEDDLNFARAMEGIPVDTGPSL